MTRRPEWGPSVFVNGAEIQTSPGQVVLSIEMQSGDQIRVTARSVAQA
jgi:hypothetical protein